MIFLVSGEGPSDIGKETYSYDGANVYLPGSWTPGPMTHFIDKIVEDLNAYSPLEYNCIYFVPKSVLSLITNEKAGLNLGSKPDTRDYINMSRGLLYLANYVSELTKDTVLPILFHDSDNHRWHFIHDNIAREYDGKCWVCPMVPNPKSEAWLLCALDKHYAGCESLEGKGGNDRSPNSLKARLKELLGKYDSPRLSALIHPDDDEELPQVDPLRIDMPSLQAFKEDLQNTKPSSYRNDSMKCFAYGFVKENAFRELKDNGTRLSLIQ